MARKRRFQARFIDTTDDDDTVLVIMFSLPIGSPGYDRVDLTLYEPGKETQFAGLRAARARRLGAAVPLKTKPRKPS